MSCGQLALQRAGIHYDNYFASEIDKYAMQITKKNFPDTIHIGNVTKVKGSDLPKIDLLIGGSPCQGFSFAGKMLNFEDPRSALFFEFVRLLHECKPKYFLLENVKMKKESELVITQALNCYPIEINSALVSAQNRRRLYWTNINSTHTDLFGCMIPGIEQPEVDEKYNLGNIAREYLLRHYGELVKGLDRKSKALMANYSYGLCDEYIYDGNSIRRLTPIECERLQTVPDNYTAGVSGPQRYKMLGNGWTVDVIAHISPSKFGKKCTFQNQKVGTFGI